MKKILPILLISIFVLSCSKEEECKNSYFDCEQTAKDIEEAFWINEGMIITIDALDIMPKEWELSNSFRFLKCKGIDFEHSTESVEIGIMYVFHIEADNKIRYYLFSHDKLFIYIVGRDK